MDTYFEGKGSGNQTALVTWVFSILAYFNSLIKITETFHWLNSRRHGAICVDDDHHWSELHCCNRHVDPHRDNLLRTGTELPSSWASFNQISSPADGGWSLRAVWNSGRPPYLWASRVQIRCTIREMIKEMTNFISINDNCCCRFTLNKLKNFAVTL